MINIHLMYIIIQLIQKVQKTKTIYLGEKFRHIHQCTRVEDPAIELTNISPIHYLK